MENQGAVPKEIRLTLYSINVKEVLKKTTYATDEQIGRFLLEQGKRACRGFVYFKTILDKNHGM